MDDGARSPGQDARDVAALIAIAADNRERMLRLELLIRDRETPLGQEALYIADRIHDTRNQMAAIEAGAERWTEARRAGRNEGRHHWFALGYAEGARAAQARDTPAKVIQLRPARAVTA